MKHRLMLIGPSAMLNSKNRESAPAQSRWWLNILLASAAIAIVAVIYVGLNPQAFSQRPAGSKLKLEEIPFNGQRAFEHLEAICQLGPRVSATDRMRQQQDYLQAHFEKLGAKVRLQEWEVRHPENGAWVTLANLIVEWHPEAKERIVLCTHYDTRPYAENDPDSKLRRKPGVFLGANDGGSGTALLCELGEEMGKLSCKYGVDFVFFDAEEFIFDSDRDPYFLGSEHFAEQYVAEPPKYTYKKGVLLDMIGDKDLQIYRELNSARWPDTQPLVTDIWNTARQLGVREFIPQTVHLVRDDHLALRNIAKIPTIDIIDFDYPRPRAQTYWHTAQDTPENCSALSLAKVGYVLKEWLKKVK